ncbi:hypothetical protein [Staphylococcus capitis]
MDWILPIAGIIAAIAFLILCIGIVVVLISAIGKIQSIKNAS